MKEVITGYHDEARRQKVMRMLDENEAIEIEIKILNTDKKRRTALQNKALHKAFRNMSDACNKKGLTAVEMYNVAREEMPVTPEACKNFFHGVLSSMGLPPKTSEMSTKEVGEIWEMIQAAFIARKGVDIGSFPSDEPPIEFYEDSPLHEVELPPWPSLR